MTIHVHLVQAYVVPIHVQVSENAQCILIVIVPETIVPQVRGLFYFCDHSNSTAMQEISSVAWTQNLILSVISIHNITTSAYMCTHTHVLRMIN